MISFYNKHISKECLTQLTYCFPPVNWLYEQISPRFSTTTGSSVVYMSGSVLQALTLFRTKIDYVVLLYPFSHLRQTFIPKRLKSTPNFRLLGSKTIPFVVHKLYSLYQGSSYIGVCSPLPAPLLYGHKRNLHVRYLSFRGNTVF